MEGQKRTSDSNAEEEHSASKQQKTEEPEDWCVACDATVKDSCDDDGHQVIVMSLAEADVHEQFLSARQHVARLQARLDDLAEARLRKGPVLEAFVEEANEDGWRVEGGDIRMSLAATQSLTAEEKKAVCEALSRMGIDYEMRGFECSMGFGYLDLNALKTVVSKLAYCVDGQTVPRGTVLLVGSQLQVHFKKARVHERKGVVQLFGRLSESSQDALEGYSYDEDIHVGPVDLCDVRFAK